MLFKLMIIMVDIKAAIQNSEENLHCKHPIIIIDTIKIRRIIKE